MDIITVKYLKKTIIYIESDLGTVIHVNPRWKGPSDLGFGCMQLSLRRSNHLFRFCIHTDLKANSPFLPLGSIIRVDLRIERATRSMLHASIAKSSSVSLSLSLFSVCYIHTYMYVYASAWLDYTWVNCLLRFDQVRMRT